MKASCEIVQDLIPLVWEQAASQDSIRLVEAHVRECDSCKQEFEKFPLTTPTEIDDKRVLSGIKKKLFLAMAALLLTGAGIGLLFNQHSPFNGIAIIIGIASISAVGLLIYRLKGKGGGFMEKFFVGRAIGTLAVFGILGIYLFLKYVLQLF